MSLISEIQKKNSIMPNTDQLGDTNPRLPLNSPGSLHNTRVSTIAGTSGLAFEHVEVVAFVVPELEAIRAEGHALRDAAGSATEGDKVRGPDQPALGGRVEFFDCSRKKR